MLRLRVLDGRRALVADEHLGHLLVPFWQSDARFAHRWLVDRLSLRLQLGLSVQQEDLEHGQEITERSFLVLLDVDVAVDWMRED